MPELTLIKLTADLAKFVQDDAAEFIAQNLSLYDFEAREVTGVKFRENRAHVISYRDTWDNNLTFVIRLTV